VTPGEREALFTRTIQEAARLRATAPASRVLQSIEQQAYYLVGVVRGTLPADRLNEVNLGLLAVREIDGWDEVLSKLLYACAAEVRVMEKEAALAGVTVTKK